MKGEKGGKGKSEGRKSGKEKGRDGGKKGKCEEREGEKGNVVQGERRG